MQVLELLDSPTSDIQHLIKYSALKVIIIKLILACGKHQNSTEGFKGKSSTCLFTPPPKLPFLITQK